MKGRKKIPGEVKALRGTDQPCRRSKGQLPMTQLSAPCASLDALLCYYYTDPAGNIKIDKASSVQKIDDIAATIMTLCEWMTQTNDESNPYESKGLLTL